MLRNRGLSSTVFCEKKLAQLKVLHLALMKVLKEMPMFLLSKTFLFENSCELLKEASVFIERNLSPCGQM